MRRAFAPLFIALFTAACGSSTPVWYEAKPGTKTWTLPLVNPLDNAELIVPVFLNERGPFKFILDPEAPATIVDRGVAERVGLFRGGSARSLG